MGNWPKDRIIFVILTVLLVASTFIGVPLNGGEKGWIYANYAFRLFLYGQLVDSDRSVFMNTISILLIGWNILLMALPVFIFTKFRRLSIIYLPLGFLILTLAYFFLLGILCLPFFILWILAMEYSSRIK